jgi:hypothetical protein
MLSKKHNTGIFGALQLRSTVEEARPRGHPSPGRLPGNTRTRNGFITFDSRIHFYSLQEGLSQTQMLIVSDIKDPPEVVRRPIHLIL